MSESPEPLPSEPSKIDREATTPFLLNFCYRSSAFHNLADFPVPTPSDPRPPLPPHVQIYTWYSCTLRELAHLLTSAMPSIVPDPAIGTRLSFRLVYPDTSSGRGGRLDDGRGRYISKEMGSVVISAPVQSNGNSGKAYELGGDDAEKTLADARFVIGDFVDCAVFPPLSDGSVVPRGSVGGRGSNGYGRSRGGAFGAGRGASIPSGEWKRGERLPDGGGGGGGYRGGGYGRGARRGPY